MIKFERHILKNGLIVLLNQDKNTPLVSFNILYDAGSKYEDENKTGLAHLFEHLMFSGTDNAPDFDFYTQMAGGENNAFTNSDIADFYITVPGKNLETAFWLESDRMVNLTLNKDSFVNEKRVVIEEFKETSLNTPYGDMWHYLAPISYDVHPYKWPTIGKKIDHIENITLDDVKEFYNNYYHPGNAILSISGNFDMDNALELAEKWFGHITKTAIVRKSIPQEPEQNTKKLKIIKENVPSNALFIAFHIAGRKDNRYYTQDLISDILGRGRSARLFQKLVKEKEMFNEIQAYVTGNMDPGLMIIEGHLTDNTDYDTAVESIRNELKSLKIGDLECSELDKLKNKIENQMAFSEISILNKAINLAQYELLGDVSLINKQHELYNKVSIDDIVKEANVIFNESNCSELIYIKE
jgi:predicted Zn-dependent peptidase